MALLLGMRRKKKERKRKYTETMLGMVNSKTTMNAVLQKQTHYKVGLFILINLIKEELKFLVSSFSRFHIHTHTQDYIPFSKPLIPGTAESDDNVIDSGSSPTRLIVNVFEHVTPLEPHKTFCIVTEKPSALRILPFESTYEQTP